MNKNDVFRQCASAFIVRPMSALDSELEVLLVHKPRKKDAWQLPQGGVEEGETTEQAAVRELQEEASLIAKPCAVSAIEYQYEFPASYRRFRPDGVCGQNIHFVHMALTPEDQIVQVDGNEIDAYQWVPESELQQFIRRQEYREIVEQLIEEYRQA